MSTAIAANDASYNASVLSEALRQATEGHRVFPLVPYAGNGHSDDGKTPAIKTWQEKATNDLEKLRKWFGPGGRYEGYGLAMRCGTEHTNADGKVEELLVVDLDKKDGKDGEVSLRAACQVNDLELKNFATRVQSTPSDGTHLLYWTSTPVQQGSNVLGPNSGVDTRTAKGYIVIAPTRINGQAYKWVNPYAPIASMGALESLFPKEGSRGEKAARANGPVEDSERAAKRAIPWLQTEAPLAVEGNGGDQLTYKVACKLRDFGCSQLQALDLMLKHWNDRCSPPWSADDLAVKVSNAYNYAQDEAGNGAPEKVFDPVLAAKDDNESRKRGLAVTCVAAVESKPIEWLWPQVFALGKHSTIAGEPGLGKSQTTIFLAAVVTTAGKLPDGTHCPQGSVVFITAEDDIADTIRPRLEAAGADLKRVHVVDGTMCATQNGGEGVRGFDVTRDISKLAELVDTLRDVKLIVIDPVSAFLGATDSHKAAEVRAAMGDITRLAETRGVALISVNHLNKNAGTSAMGRVSGSGAFVAAPRAAYIVTRDKNEPTLRVMAPLKNNIGDDLTAYFFKVVGVTLSSGIDTSRVEWQDRTEELSADEALDTKPVKGSGEAISRAQTFLMEQLKDGPRLGDEIKKAAAEDGISPATLRRAREALRVDPTKQEGKHAKYVWKLPETPRCANDLFS